MQNVACPGCGAPVTFRATASVMAVCQFCKTTVLKDAASVRDYGKLSDVLADYSVLQIGTAGSFGGHAFTVVGRLQLRYDASMWNEWFIVFDDGTSSWLSEASGMYTITTERALNGPAPPFQTLVPGQTYPIEQKGFVAADIRTARCIGGQGELPFAVGPGWQARVADFRADDNFLTLDYSEADRVRLYTGQAVTLAELQCQLLRDDDSVRESAGKFTGKVGRLDCPACGSNVAFVPGLTTQLTCPSCHASVDTSTEVATVLAVGARLAAVKTSLELGALARIAGVPYELIGCMRCSGSAVSREDGDEAGGHTEWTEYLLYAPRAGFLWLVETDGGWFRSAVQERWPQSTLGSEVKLGQRSFHQIADYTATVTFAAGAFNWRVAVGDRTRIIEYENGATQLAAEITECEINWSLVKPVPADQVKAWFGAGVNGAKKKTAAAATGNCTAAAKTFSIGLLLVNAVPLLMSFGRTWIFTVIGIGCIYVLAYYQDNLIDKDE
jgi:uncharacterized protein (DUF983 family)